MNLPVTKDSIFVLKCSEAKGCHGLPEVGNVPISGKLIIQGVYGLVRISDDWVCSIFGF